MLKKPWRPIVAAGRAVAKALPSMLRDLLCLGGAAAISYGAWTIYRPAGFIVAGLFALAAGLVGSLRAERAA